ncbi:hypothetical protein T552_00074 [Pneumocystis carinii B80]|uniref:Large ribosomal subunit protein mL50 n=1 Tax=Pneumocystis carinii (strain B80) TaxID=1408658 RepID=A0A0W4ZSV1_PNEC8|nr:hypothetical protein T552_00074 [Pneumocystis carinii B80]KTW31430.1 hypothetical protein T552_00074 [Pneumocystis carinii B80]
MTLYKAIFTGYLGSIDSVLVNKRQILCINHYIRGLNTTSKQVQQTSQEEGKEVFKVPKERQFSERRRYRCRFESLNGFKISPYGRKKPIKDIKKLEEAVKTAIIKSTDGKNDGSSQIILEEDQSFKLRMVRALYKETGHRLPDNVITKVKSVSSILKYYKQAINELKRKKDDPPVNKQLFKGSNVYIET